MSFLAPLFLIGALGIALPVVFHLIRRSSRERIPFSSLMFLLPTPPRVTRRSKLENVFLLLLRCLVLCLLAFAFARPFFSQPVAPDPAANQGRKVLVLLDTSASMRRGDLWAQALAKAETAFRQATMSDRVACYLFSREIQPLISFDQWTAMSVPERAALASKRLSDVKPGWASTDVGTALIRACEMFEASSKDEQSPKQIVLITDLQEGSRLDGLQGFEWPRGVQISVELVRATRTSNAGLQLAPEKEAVGKAGAETATRVRVSNSSDSKREQFQLGWQRLGAREFVGATLDTYIPPGQNRVVPIVKPPAEPAPEKLVLSGDEEDFDNTLYILSAPAERARILFLGRDQETDSSQSLFYLRRAFQETRRLAPEVIVVGPEANLAEEAMAGASLVIVNDPLPPPQLAVVRQSFLRGKTILVPLSKLANTASLGQLIGIPTLAAEEASSATYAMLGQIDFEHPLFSAFADPRYSDFTKIHFWKHRRLNLEKVANTRILARFDDGDPAVAEISEGQGKVWVLASGWQPEDSQLALSSKFVPLLYAMLEQSGGMRTVPPHYTVGDAVPMPAGADSVTVRKPDASEIKLEKGEKFTGTDQPGIYTVTSMQSPVTFAVNLAPEESKTAPLPVEQLERLGLPLQHQLKSAATPAGQKREHLQAAQLESRQKLWRWLIVAALVVLVIETWLAGRLTRRALPVGLETQVETQI